MDMSNAFGNISPAQSDYEFGITGSDNFPDQDLYDPSTGSTTQSSASPADFQNVAQFFPDYTAGQVYPGVKEDAIGAAPGFGAMYQQPQQPVMPPTQNIQHMQSLQQAQRVSLSQPVPSPIQVSQGQQEQAQLQLSPQLHLSPQLALRPRVQMSPPQIQMSPQQMLTGIKVEHQQGMEGVPPAIENVASGASPNNGSAKGPARRKRENRYKNAPPSVLSRRRAQNRASQRAYRERKDQRIKDLETMLAQVHRNYTELSLRYDDLSHVLSLSTQSNIIEPRKPDLHGNSQCRVNSTVSSMAPFTMPPSNAAPLSSFDATMATATFGMPSPDQVEYSLYSCQT